MNLKTFRNKLKNTPEAITFPETMDVIEKHYEFHPTAFKNGTLENAKGEN
ncbi:hypothetical protein JCM19302_4029 [Jejuia pallidilutea]|nr:hypothetical protein JCM19302_4029 [Jejuia pallidilutea]